MRSRHTTCPWPMRPAHCGSTTSRRRAAATASRLTCAGGSSGTGALGRGVKGYDSRKASWPAMAIRTKRWNDPAEPDDGYRVLVTCYRPRGVSKAEETWDVWMKHLGPSKELHAAAYGKTGGSPLPWPQYRA